MFTASKTLFIIVALIIVTSTSCVLSTSPVPPPRIVDMTLYRLSNGKLSFGPTGQKLPNDDGASSIICKMFGNFSMNITGWDVVRLTADPDYLKKDVLMTYYGCGYLEGYYTYESILNNNYSSTPLIKNTTKLWLQTNLAWLEKYEQQAKMNITFGKGTTTNNNNNVLCDTCLGPNGENSDVVMQQFVARNMKLLAGMRDGINQAIDDFKVNATKWTMYDVFLLNVQPELSDMERAANLQAGITYSTKDPNHNIGFASRKKHQLFHDTGMPKYTDLHCSALIRLTADDVYMAHNTWSSFSNCLRQFKTYDFEISISMSSYPGFVSSMDDWLQTGHKLVVHETTNDQDNETLTELYTTPQTVPEFMRNMACNFFATTGKQWVTLFLVKNNGAYNNQFQILDLKLITSANIKNQTLKPGTLWIVEQMPGPYSSIGDVTYVVNRQKYWPSFNIPFWLSIRILNDDREYEEYYGDFFSYTHYARARIFRRDAPKVADLEGMKKILRYNDWQNDPFSKITNCSCTAAGTCCVPPNSPHLSIANRADLVPANATFGNLDTKYDDAASFYSLGGWGAIDVKITSWKMMMKNSNNNNGGGQQQQQQDLVRAAVISGPTYDQQPVFRWSTAPKIIREGYPHRGQPDEWHFPWQYYSTPGFRLGAAAQAWTDGNGGDDQNKSSNIGIILGAIGGVIVIAVGVYFFLKSELAARLVGKKKTRSAISSDNVTPQDVFEGAGLDGGGVDGNGGDGGNQTVYRQMGDNGISEV